jgi:enoyl-CoA hydratase/carnithine racemase
MEHGLKIETGTDELQAELVGRVAVVTLNRPKALNALTGALVGALAASIKSLGEDPDVGSILLTGAGTAFCAGGDMNGMKDNANLLGATFEQQVANLREEQRRLIGGLVELRKPTIAALPGAAAGAGLALALACDIRIASQSCILTTAFARVALAGDCGINWLLTRLVGPSRARELMMLAERVDSQRAETLGLVNRVVPNAELMATALKVAATLAAGPPIAFRLIKNNLDHAMTSDLLESLDYEAENHIRAKGTLDHKEGVRAFVEKRKPIFQGN